MLILVLPMSIVEKMLHFIYLDVKILDRKIVTNLHIKATDRHQYLHYTSSHPYHTKESIVYIQALRVSRIYSFEYSLKIFIKKYLILVSCFHFGKRKT